MLSKWKLAFLLVIVLLVAVAPSFALEVTVSGNLNQYDNTQDEYPIYVVAGERINVFLTCVSGPDFDTYLEIHGPNGFYRDNDDGGSDSELCGLDQDSYSSGTSFVAPTTGIYVIVATSYAEHNNYIYDWSAIGGYSLTISGNFEVRFAFNADGRLNHGYGDLYAVLYSVDDADGNRAIDVYCFSGEEWTLALRVSQGSGNTSAAGCDVAVFALADGSYQFNITTDGKLYTLICGDLACSGPQLSYFDPNE
jgi:hypothetical protein